MHFISIPTNLKLIFLAFLLLLDHYAQGQVDCYGCSGDDCNDPDIPKALYTEGSNCGSCFTITITDALGNYLGLQEKGCEPDRVHRCFPGEERMILFNGREARRIYTKCSCIFPKCNERDGIPATFEKKSRMANDTASGSQKKGPYTSTCAIMVTAVGMLAKNMGYLEALFIWLGLLVSQVNGDAAERQNPGKIRCHSCYRTDCDMPMNGTFIIFKSCKSCFTITMSDENGKLLGVERKGCHSKAWGDKCRPPTFRMEVVEGMQVKKIFTECTCSTDLCNEENGPIKIKGEGENGNGGFLASLPVVFGSVLMSLLFYNCEMRR